MNNNKNCLPRIAFKLDMIVHACNLRIWRLEARESQVQGQPGLFKIRASPLTFESLWALFSSLSPPYSFYRAETNPRGPVLSLFFTQSHVIVWHFLTIDATQLYCACIFSTKYWKPRSHRPRLKAACWLLLQRSDPVVSWLGTLFCSVETEPVLTSLKAQNLPQCPAKNVLVISFDREGNWGLRHFNVYVGLHSCPSWLW